MIRATYSVFFRFRCQISKLLFGNSWIALVIGVLLCCTILAFTPQGVIRPFPNRMASSGGSAIASKPQSARQAVAPALPGTLFDRLALQPIADQQRRRLGKRFLVAGQEISMLSGTLALGKESHAIRLVRTRNDDDEQLTIALDNDPAALTWSGVGGARSNGSQASGNIRSLIERIALDSPDQFVLAQTRGASYYMVARRARPEGMDNSQKYAGPVWDLVRVAEPSRLTQQKPQSLWRLYFINSSTGLIDKVVSQEQGGLLTAEFSEWANQDGETSPRHFVWKQNDQVVMDLTFTNVTHRQKQ